MFGEQRGGEVRLGVFGHEFGSFVVGLKRLPRIAAFERVRKGDPGAGLSFFDMRGRFEARSGAEELLSLGTVGALEHEPEIEVGLKNVSLGGDRVAIGGNGFVGTVEAVEGEAEIEPCLIEPWRLAVWALFLGIVFAGIVLVEVIVVRIVFV